MGLRVGMSYIRQPLEFNMAENRTIATIQASLKIYKAPKLIVYGGAVHLTASGTKPSPEGGGAGNVIKKP